MHIFYGSTYFLLSFWKMNIGVSLWCDIVKFSFLLQSCQVLFSMDLKGVFLGVYSLSTVTFPLWILPLSVWGMALFLWYIFTVAVTLFGIIIALFAFFFVKHFSGTDFQPFISNFASCFPFGVISYKQRAPGMHYCCVYIIWVRVFVF